MASIFVLKAPLKVFVQKNVREKTWRCSAISRASRARPRANKQDYLPPVVTFGSSIVTVDDFEPIVPVAKRIPPPTTMTIRAPTSTPMIPMPLLLSAMNISHGCRLDDCRPLLFRFDNGL
jgi:hypothetical protein